MNAQLELDSLILEDLEFDTSCEGRLHETGGRGHNPSLGATHYLTCPACNKVTFICAARAVYIRNLANMLGCSGCLAQRLGSEWPVCRIPGK